MKEDIINYIKVLQSIGDAISKSSSSLKIADEYTIEGQRIVKAENVKYVSQLNGFINAIKAVDLPTELQEDNKRLVAAIEDYKIAISRLPESFMGDGRVDEEVQKARIDAVNSSINSVEVASTDVGNKIEKLLSQ
ncbi:hypothetical protein ACI2JA_15610 [Alkalihalobacillus sp. NPDC078783]